MTEGARASSHVDGQSLDEAARTGSGVTVGCDRVSAVAMLLGPRGAYERSIDSGALRAAAPPASGFHRGSARVGAGRSL
jgi:hypothetical protein